MRDDGPPAGGEMIPQPAEKPVEESAAVGTARAPARQAAGIAGGLHRKLRQIGGRDVEAAPFERPPHITAMHLDLVAMPQAVQQKRAGRDSRAFDIDAAKR